MSLHPKALEVVEKLKSMGGGVVRTDWTMSAYEKSEISRKLYSDTEHLSEEVGQIIDVEIPTSWGKIPARFYYPLKYREGTGAYKGFMFIHGGGFCMGSIEQYDALCEKLTNKTGRIVLSFEYRLAPKYRHPCQLEDCVSVAQWLFDNADHYMIDKNHIVIGGDSAGGCLTANTCMYFRDRNGVLFEKQVMIYPTTDFVYPMTNSMIENDDKTHMNIEAVIWSDFQYLSPDIDLNAIYLFPNRQSNLKDLPPCFIITAEYDVLRDEAEIYGNKLCNAGNVCKIKRYDGMTHTFLLNYKNFEQAEEAFSDIRDFCG